MTAFLSVLIMIWDVLKVLIIPVVFIFGLAAILLMIYFIVFVTKGYRPIKGEHNIVHRAPWWKNIFYYFPMRYILDYFDRDPEFFRHQGCVIFTGRQGNGKTIAMVEQAFNWQREYPKSKVITNLAYKFQKYRCNGYHCYHMRHEIADNLENGGSNDVSNLSGTD